MQIRIGIAILALLSSGLIGVGCKKDTTGTSMPPKKVDDLVSKDAAPESKGTEGENKAESGGAESKSSDSKSPDTPTSSDTPVHDPSEPSAGEDKGVGAPPNTGGGMEPANPGDGKGVFEEKGPPPQGGPGEPKGPPPNRDRPDNPPPVSDGGELAISSSGYIGEYEVVLSAEQQKMIEGVQKMMKDQNGKNPASSPEMKKFTDQMMSMVKQFRLVIQPKGLFQLKVPMSEPEKGTYSVSGNKLVLKVDVAKADPKLNGMSLQNLTLAWDPGKKTLSGMAQGMLTTFRKVK